MPILNIIKPTMEVQQLQQYDFEQNEFIPHQDSIGTRFPRIKTALNEGLIEWNPVIQVHLDGYWAR
jgi:hypothetical protein